MFTVKPEQASPARLYASHKYFAFCNGLSYDLYAVTASPDPIVKQYPLVAVLPAGLPASTGRIQLGATLSRGGDDSIVAPHSV